MIVVLLPLLHIWLTGRFALYYSYFVVLAAFFALNLAGAGTENIGNTGQAGALHFSLFVTAAVLSGVYPLLRAMRGNKKPYTSDAGKLRNFAGTSRSFRKFIWFLFGAVSAGVIPYCMFFVRPLILNAGMFGDFHDLISARTAVLTGAGHFHWVELLLYEVPLFMVIACVIFRQAARRAGLRREYHAWTALAWLVLPWAAVLAVTYMMKMPLIMLLAALFLASMIGSSSLAAKSAAMLAVIFSALIPFYMLYFGFSAERLQYILNIMAHRIFECYPWSAAMGLYLFPSQMGFLDGASLVNYMNLFNFEQVMVGRMIFPYIYEGTGSAPMPALYELYANYGWTGFAAGHVAIVALILLISRMSWSRRPFAVVAAVYLSLQLISVWMTAFWFGILDLRVLCLMLALAGLWLAGRARGRGGVLPRLDQLPLGELQNPGKRLCVE